MRDKNAPQKRASMRENGRESPRSGPLYPGGHSGAYSHGGSSTGSYSRPPSEGSLSPPSLNARLSGKGTGTARLLDLYYNFFHKAHPFLLPQYHFRNRLHSDPESLKHILPVMQYIGSLYASEVPSTELHAATMTQLDISSLPPNGFTVQMLLLTAIAVHCDGELEQGRAILDRAISLALELRMHSRAFATMERDPVLAESWRRTFWSLYISDAYFATMKRAPMFTLHSIEADVEIPCEECEYDGIIPRPKTLDEYESRDFEDETPVFSSYAYLIDLVRISGSLLPLDTTPAEYLESAVVNADAMLVNWKLHLPKEKQSVVDKNEEIDEVLFQAHNFLQILLVHIHRPLSRLYHSPIEKVSHCAPPPPDHNTTSIEDKTYWLHTKKTLEAAEAAINLYALPTSIINHTPLGICGIVLSTLANLSACAYILTGSEWYRTRDRVRLGLGCLKTFSEVWEVSRWTEKETKKIARTVFAMPRPGMERAGAFGPADGLKVWEPQVQVQEMSDLVEDWTTELGEVSYEGLFSGVEQGGWYGIENAVSSA